MWRGGQYTDNCPLKLAAMRGSKFINLNEKILQKIKICPYLFLCQVSGCNLGLRTQLSVPFCLSPKTNINHIDETDLRCP